jgi:hypothetical protein
MISAFDSLVLEKKFRQLNGRMFNNPIGDLSPESMELIEASGVQTKNLCAKVSPELADQVDDVCATLGLSKRRFLEAAFITAVARAHELMQADDVFVTGPYPEGKEAA